MSKPDPQPPSSAKPPPQSPAERLAAVLRVLYPRVDVSIQSDGAVQVYGSWPRFWIHHKSKDDLARVVGMLTAEQRGRFDNAMEREVWDFDTGGAVVGREFVPLTASEALTAPPEKILAALEAAVLGR